MRLASYTTSTFLNFRPQFLLWMLCGRGVCHALDGKGVRRKHGAYDHGVLQRRGVRPDDGFVFMPLGLHWGSVPAPRLSKRLLGARNVRHTQPGTRTTLANVR